MLFNSADYLLFLPIAVITYYIMPGKMQRLWLLLLSFAFFCSRSVFFGIAAGLVALSSYILAILIEKYSFKQKTSKTLLVIGIVIEAGLLVFLKYVNSIESSFISLLGGGIRFPQILAPLGISYYSLKSIAYLVQVYWGKIPAEQNIINYLLYIVFFPTFTQGPIESPEKFLPQLKKSKTKFCFNELKDGLLLIIWGFFLKLVIADRLAFFVNCVYDNLQDYSGWYYFAAACFYSLQLYCDFYGCTCIALGSAEMLGISLSENFHAPFLSNSMTELWGRWHITLTKWLTQYIYIPLGGSRKGTLRKYLNIMVVFLVSGFWHGAGLGFFIWGAINGIYEIIDNLVQPFVKKLIRRMQINEKSVFLTGLGAVKTFLMFSLVFVFFRVTDASKAFYIITGIFRTTVSPDGNNFFQCGIDIQDFCLLAVCLFVLLISDIFKVKNISVRAFVLKRNEYVQALVFSVSIVFVLIFGLYGPGFDASGFIYAGF